MSEREGGKTNLPAVLLGAGDPMGRRGLLGGAAMGALLFAACRGGVGMDQQGGGAKAGGGNYPFGKPLKAAFVNAGLANSWPAQGKAATEQWSKWLGVDVTWYDGGLSIDKQRKAVDNIAMAETVTETLFKAIGGEGNVIHTQGALGHSGAKKRGEGFKRALARYPKIKLVAEDSAEWDVNKTAKLWEDYLVKFPKIDAAFFHSDDMGLAAAKVIKNAGRDVKLGSVDAMPEAIEAVKDGRLLVTVRNSTCRIHWGAVVIGALAATGTKNIPKYIQIDGPVVTKEIAEGMA